jgi:hypothetical protein
MQNNLIPPFMMREACLHARDIPKIQVDDPSIEDHSILFPDSNNFRIPLSLWEVFSYFPTSKPTARTLNEIKEVYMLTPSRWNPHQDAFATNEESMIDWEGNLIEKIHRKRIILSDIADDTAMAASVKIGSVDTRLIDEQFERDFDYFDKPKHPYLQVPRVADKVVSVLGTIDPILNDETLCPIVFWDYCVEHRARINNLTAKGNFKLHSSDAYTLLTSAEGDISNLCQYGWYDWCYYREQTAKFPFNCEVLGRVLGPARGEGK